MIYKHLFGPVISRRLGVSLGIDLVPFKVCPMNCVYCEVGETTNLTCKTDEYVPFDEIICELDDYITHNPKLDYITFSGSGEPMLHSRLGEIVSYIKKSYPNYKLALITNSVLLTNPKLLHDIIDVDLIMPSLDAVSHDIFKAINRPSIEVNPDEIVKALIELRKSFKGQIWLEIFLIEGVNDSDKELNLLLEATRKIKPDRVQLNSLDRPGVEAWVKAMNPQRLQEIRDYFALELGETSTIEVIAKVQRKVEYKNFNPDVVEQVLGLISRRPCTNLDLSKTLGLHVNEVNKVLHSLVSENRIEATHEDRGAFYRIKG